MRDGAGKKVLFVIGTLGRGGAEHQMVLLIENLVRQGVECAVFVLDGSGPLRTRLEAARVRIHAMNYLARTSRLGVLAALVSSWVSLWWIAMRWRPNVLQSYLPLTNIMGALAGRLAFVPLVITCRRGLGTHQERHPYWFLLDRIANSLSHVVTCNSLAVGYDTLKRDRIAAGKLMLVRNALDVARFEEVESSREAVRQELGLGPETTAVVTIANLIPYKGHSDLLDAISILRPNLRSHRFFLVGRDDGIGAQLKQKARDLAIDESVVFCGLRHDAIRILKAMDLFVLPSHEEGFSNALLEAMAAGLAVVATNVGGNPEALEDWGFGQLVPARDPAALARAIETAIRSIGETRELRREAGHLVRLKYSTLNMVESHLALYHGWRAGLMAFVDRDPAAREGQGSVGAT
jgi:glycosyltransferase involved in cell wall biosynthesis